LLGLSTTSRWRRIGTDNPAELLRGTLDLLVLRTLVRQANHGYGIEQYRPDNTGYR
jgi:hypothetical protein